MSTRVKLLDVGLIRTFGSAFVNMDDNQARKYIDLGKAKFVNAVVKENERSAMDSTNEDKTKWSPPEAKLFNPDQKVNEGILKAPYPGPNDILFTQIQ